MAISIFGLVFPVFAGLLPVYGHAPEEREKAATGQFWTATNLYIPVDGIWLAASAGGEVAASVVRLLSIAFAGFEAAVYVCRYWNNNITEASFPFYEWVLAWIELGLLVPGVAANIYRLVVATGFLIDFQGAALVGEESRIRYFMPDDFLEPVSDEQLEVIDPSGDYHESLKASWEGYG